MLAPPQDPDANPGLQNFLQCDLDFESSSCQLVDGHQVQKNKPNSHKT
jgi:uncharacterized protein YggU (UPF0235/DUF167 family)